MPNLAIAALSNISSNVPLICKAIYGSLHSCHAPRSTDKEGPLPVLVLPLVVPAGEAVPAHAPAPEHGYALERAPAPEFAPGFTPAAAARELAPPPPAPQDPPQMETSG